MSALQVLLQDKLKKSMKRDQWEEVSCPLCSDNKSVKKKTAGFVCNDNGGIGYNCFRCNTKIKWVPTEKPKKKFKDLLEKFGITEQDLNNIDLTQ